MKTRSLVILFAFFGTYFHSIAQDSPVHPSIIGQGVFLGTTPKLSDLPVLSATDIKLMEEKAAKKLLNNKLKVRSYPFSETALPKGPDNVWQKEMGKTGTSRAPIQNFEGQTSPYYPPDCNGTAGPNHYMQTVNSTYAIYSKAGVLLAGPTNMNLLFGSVTGSACNDGDPLILYDEQADRWLAIEFSICGANDYMLVAVSTTNNPTGIWNKYSFDVADMPDYEKFGIWQDGYYMGDNNSAGNDIYVFQRSVMLAGGVNPQMVAFKNPNRPTSIDGFMCVPPVDNDGAFAPTGSPATFIAFNDDAIGGGADQLWLFELAVNWTTPASSTFNRVQQLAVSPFDSNFGNDWTNIAQPVTTQQLDAIPQVIMNVPQYRNFGTYQTLVCCHSVDVDNTDHAGVRWYELRRGTQTSGNWAIRQQGTYAPDIHSRWMGSIMLSGTGELGLGYSVSSSTVYPGIRFTGQTAAAYNEASGLMDLPEDVIQTGANYQSTYERWGDYAQMSVDPSDDETFWFTSEYIGSGGTRRTKIGSFKVPNYPVVVTLQPSAITNNSATLNGSVNPDGISTTYYFEWGTSLSYGNTTSSVSAGSGLSTLNVNQNIGGLVNGTTYHYRIVATNSDGTANGGDISFVAGAAILTTTTVTSITTNSASSGGEITSDGGTAITEKGVCWATSANPTISGSHTSDGTGIGLFTSSLTGLTSNTVYHVRAYATNSGGISYGNDISFKTLCGNITSFPWTEGFENGGVIPTCWTQEQVAGSGINWSFIAGNGDTRPASAHTGVYNACLKDATTADNKTKLITPSLDLSGPSGYTLTFWHTQTKWTPDQDQLTVFYKTSSGGTWTQLAIYTSSISSWTMETIYLPNGSSDYYIAFEGNAKYGYGVCVDDVSVTATPAALFRSKASADWTAFATTWQMSSNGGTSWITALYEPTGVDDVTILNTHFVTVTSDFRKVNNLTINTGGKIYTNNSDLVNGLKFVTVYGNLVCDGTVGNGAVDDAISFIFSGAGSTLSGTGTFTAGKIKISPAGANLNVIMNIELRANN